jgi:uncharacterized protein
MTANLAIKPAAMPYMAMSALELDGYLTGVVVTPQSPPIMPGVWLAPLCGEHVFDNDFHARLVLGRLLNQYNALEAEIDSSLKRLEANKIADYRPRFLSEGEKPSHDAVRTWVQGFWKAMSLAPQVWSSLVEDERTRIVILPYLGFIDTGEAEPPEIAADELDRRAALIPRTVLTLRKLARMRPVSGDPFAHQRRSKVGRNDPCPCGSSLKYKRCCSSS